MVSNRGELEEALYVRLCLPCPAAPRRVTGRWWWCEGGAGGCGVGGDISPGSALGEYWPRLPDTCTGEAEGLPWLVAPLLTWWEYPPPLLTVTLTPPPPPARPGSATLPGGAGPAPGDISTDLGSWETTSPSGTPPLCSVFSLFGSEMGKM